MDLGLPPAKRTKTGFSTDAEVLENPPAHPVVEKILLPADDQAQGHLPGRPAGRGRPDTAEDYPVPPGGHRHRAHQFLGPNLQNIPVRTDMGREIRKAFVAGPATCWWMRTTPRSSCGCWPTRPATRA